MELGFLLPVAVGVLCHQVLSLRFGNKISSAECTLISLLLMGVVVVVGVQLLSALHALNGAGFVLVWLTTGMAVLAAAYRLPRISTIREKITLLAAIRAADYESRLMALVIYGFATVLGLVAAYAIPNNWDSMGYHLARVAYWRQYSSISFFATNNPRQNNMGPFAEWAILQLSYLQGHIVLANTIQWVSYLGCILTVSEMCRLMGGNPRERMITAFFCATLFMAILQATSTQNDLVESFWLALTAYGCVRSIVIPSWTSTTILGTALGLALLTKTTTLFFATPLVLWFIFSSFSKGWKNLGLKLAFTGALVISLNAGHFLRNMATAGSPFGPNGKNGHEYTNEIHNPAAIFSNIVRNLALHGQILHHGSGMTTAVVVKLHRWLGLDPFDPRTTWVMEHENLLVSPGNEDGCAMLVQLAIILIGSVWIVCIGRRQYSALYYGLIGSVLAGAFLFCFVLKWQIWHARLHLPLFVLASPLAAAFMEREMNTYVRRGLLIVMFLGAARYVAFNPYRPAFGHQNVFMTKAEDQRYHVDPARQEPYTKSLRILEAAKVRSVGLVSDDSWEYSLLDPKEDGYAAPFTIDHVLVEGAYARFEKPECPDAIICIDKPPAATITVNGREYKSVYQSILPEGLLNIGVFLPESANGTPARPITR